MKGDTVRFGLAARLERLALLQERSHLCTQLCGELLNRLLVVGLHSTRCSASNTIHASHQRSVPRNAEIARLWREGEPCGECEWCSALRLEKLLEL